MKKKCDKYPKAKKTAVKAYPARITNTTKKPSKSSKNTPKKAREIVTVSNYQKLAMRTCLPQCKCFEYVIPELCSEWFEALAKIEGMRAKLVRLDGNANIAEWKANKLKEIRDELGDVFWSVALLCELKGARFEFVFKNTSATSEEGLNLSFEFCEPFEADLEPRTQIGALKRICRELGIKPTDCLRANIAKLAKRQTENKLQGDGDKR